MTVRAKTDRGNDAFREKRYKTARACYTQALEKGGKDTVLGDTVAARVAAAVQTGDVGRSAALNRAACRYVREDACADREEQSRANARVSLFYSLELGLYSDCVDDCTLVLGVEPTNPKALVRCCAILHLCGVLWCDHFRTASELPAAISKTPVCNSCCSFDVERLSVSWSNTQQPRKILLRQRGLSQTIGEAPIGLISYAFSAGE